VIATNRRPRVEPAPIEERSLTARDAAEILRRHPRVVREHQRRRELKALQPADDEASNSQNSNVLYASEPSVEAAEESLAGLTKAELDTVLKRLRKRPPKYKKDPEGKLVAARDSVVNEIHLIEAFATADGDLIGHLLGQLADTVPYGEHRNISNINFVAAALHSIGPRDGLETLLAVQMVGVHNIAMQFLKRTASKEQTEFGLDVNVGRATRFLRLFAIQMEALKAYRRKGEQKVKVEHVHVHQGGQAIVGAVSSTTEGGDVGKIEGCTRFKATRMVEKRESSGRPDQSAALPSEDPKGNALQ
jgi:hypothetical protein